MDRFVERRAATSGPTLGRGWWTAAQRLDRFSAASSLAVARGIVDLRRFACGPPRERKAGQQTLDSRAAFRAQQDNETMGLQALRETGATGLEPATSGVTGMFHRNDDWRRSTRYRSIHAGLRAFRGELCTCVGSISDVCCPSAAQTLHARVEAVAGVGDASTASFRRGQSAGPAERRPLRVAWRFEARARSPRRATWAGRVRR
jgi:hypothetical protein